MAKNREKNSPQTSGGEVAKKRWSKLDITIAVIALIAVFYQFVLYKFLIVTDLIFDDIHYAFILVIVFLHLMRKEPKFTWIWAVCIALSLYATGYIFFNEDALIDRAGDPTFQDLIVGTLLILVAFISTWRIWGKVIPLIAIAFIALAFLMQFLPYPLYSPAPSYARLITMLSIGLTGMWGMMIKTSANVIFYFMVFGCVFQATGATEFFNIIGRMVGRVSVAGPAQTAVVTSTLFATTSGSVMANAATTGSFTIPTMIKAGFKRHDAAAFEATASAGGQIMPPIMGATAFIMSAVLAVPYTEIAVRAIIPAVLFFLCIGIQSELIARRDRIKKDTNPEPIDKRELFLLAPLFLVPLAILVWLLFAGHSVAYSTGPSILSMIILSCLRKKTRPSFGTIIDGFSKGAVSAAEVGVTTVALSPIVVLSTYTGLGIKLPGVVKAISGGITFFALVLAAVVAIILGMGVPTPVIYLLVAVIICPSLVKMGMQTLPVHMFAFYFGIMCTVTPPVATAALVTSRIADAPFFRTSFCASKLAIVGFVVPFLFCYNPVLLGYWTGSSVSDIFTIVLALVLVVVLSIAVVGFLYEKTSPVVRGMAILSALGFALAICTLHYAWIAMGVAFIAAVFVVQLKKKSSLASIAQAQPQAQTQAQVNS